MNIFIDTNTLLSFFGIETSSKILDQLTDLIKSEEVKLVYTEQVENEFYKHINMRIDKERKRILNIRFDINDVPQIFDEKKQKHLQGKVEKIEEDVEEHKKKRLKRYDKESKRTKKKMEELLTLGKKLPYTPEIIEKAQIRFIKNLPPRKPNDTFCGDAISWELLLAEKMEGEDFFIITNDNDYKDKAEGETIFSEYLRKEWESESRPKIIHFNTIGEFINNFEEKNVVEEDEIQKEYISSADDYLIVNPGLTLVTNSALKQIDTLRDSITTLQDSIDWGRVNNVAVSAVKTVESLKLNPLSDQIENLKTVVKNYDAGINLAEPYSPLNSNDGLSLNSEEARKDSNEKQN